VREPITSLNPANTGGLKPKMSSVGIVKVLIVTAIPLSAVSSLPVA
jgi:hypothetical protein